MSDSPFSVFVGSSTESQAFMDEMVAWIEGKDTTVRTWKEVGTFPPGRYTLDRLLQLARDCQAAIFLFGEDDKIQRGSTESYQPRDNVLIEYGLFVAVLGIQNVLICRSKGVRMASDLAGLTRVDFDGHNKGDVKLRIKDWLENCRRGSAPSQPVGKPPHEHQPAAAPPPTARPGGIVSPDELASNRRLSEEVFAVELLNRPIRLERDEAGKVTVTVDRGGVEQMLISNEGKTTITQQCVTPENKQALLELDREIQCFLAGGTGSPGSLPIDLRTHKICLRWASGGILSIVTDAEGKRWVPLFFRDIRPYGWNLALGTTERWFTGDVLDRDYALERDLKEPKTFMMREFLEETLIVTGAPEQPGTHRYRRFRFPHDQMPIAATRARQFHEEHRRLREEDGLFLLEAEGEVEVRFLEPACALCVKSGSRSVETDGVLICFSLLDLGIEIVQVAEYPLAAGDWILDGEIRERHDAATGKTDRELIRMPTALLSLDYLRGTFGRGQDFQRYTFGPQPSIEVDRAPDPDRGEIKLFEWDVKRRMAAVAGEWDARSMSSRFVDWYDKFGEYFAGNRRSHVGPAKLFVPGAAKILNLYFSTLERGETRR